MSNLSKTLLPSIYRYIPKYIQEQNPKYVKFIETFITLLESENFLKWFDDSSPLLNRQNSLYGNVSNLRKYILADEFPVENKDATLALFKDWAVTLDYRNSMLNFTDETLRKFIKYSTMIYSAKDSSSSYTILFSILSDYLFNGNSSELEFEVYYNNQSTFEDTEPVDFYNIIEVTSIELENFIIGQIVSDGASITGIVKYIDSSNETVAIDINEGGDFSTGDDVYDISTGSTLLASSVTKINSNESLVRKRVVLSEYPAYEINPDAFESNTVVTTEDVVMGTRPFEYQIISKNDILVSGNFISNVRKTMHPAGMRQETIYIPDDMFTDEEIESKTFPKQIIVNDCPTPSLNDPISKSIQSGNEIKINNDIQLVSLLDNEETERALRVKKQKECGMIK